MKEITRIHIAKISYDIELKAKKDLEAYLKTLEAYSGDTEIIDDVEIRITEILSERGVNKDGVIAEADVAALKQQLGEPRDFMGDGDIEVHNTDGESNNQMSRKLYRDTDNAVLGGVLSGIAAFYKINPLWLRLVFIILALASLGTAILVYIVLWIAVPPARTAADRLQMAGRSVTLESIRELNESENGRLASGKDKTVRRVGTMLLGVFCIIGAVSAAVITSLAAAAVVAGGTHNILGDGVDSGFFKGAFVLGIVSGLLLTTLFIMSAYASFAQKLTRRIVVGACVVIVLGLSSFGTAIGLIQYGSIRYEETIKSNTHDASISLPAGMSSVSKLSVDSPDIDVQYVVDDSASTAVLRSVFENPKDAGILFEVKDDTLKITGSVTKIDTYGVFWRESLGPVLTIHGPALGSIKVDQKSFVGYQAKSQNKLDVVTDQSAEVLISEGSVDSLTVMADDRSSVSGGKDATIKQLEATIKSAVNLNFGTVQSLILDEQKSCSRNAWPSKVNLWKIGDNKMTINGVESSAETTKMSCTKLTIESEEKE